MAINIFVATVKNKGTDKEVVVKNSADGPYVIVTTESDVRTLCKKYADSIDMVTQGIPRGNEYSAVVDARYKENADETLYKITIVANQPFLIE